MAPLFNAEIQQSKIRRDGRMRPAEQGWDETARLTANRS
jgi:hypothetical protein